MNNVKRIREAKGITLMELARRASIMALHLQRLEQYGWKRSQTGMETDERIAAALGEPLWKVFPEAYESPYPRPKKPEPPPKVDTRTDKEIDETIKALNERRQAAGRFADERDTCHYEETSPGVMQGFGDFHHWQRLQKQKK
ncbi:MAG: hypothetical protein PWP72_806 [Thermoanaerobacter sp.]|jgi:transcriptional regulator with XRE-family HTH domain|nr:hypothetical protein [Thermoanaerobacter sp.]